MAKHNATRPTGIARQRPLPRKRGKPMGLLCDGIGRGANLLEQIAGAAAQGGGDALEGRNTEVRPAPGFNLIPVLLCSESRAQGRLLIRQTSPQPQLADFRVVNRHSPLIGFSSTHALDKVYAYIYSVNRQWIIRNKQKSGRRLRFPHCRAGAAGLSRQGAVVTINISPKLRVTTDPNNWIVQTRGKKDWSNRSYHARLEWALESILRGRLLADESTLDLDAAVYRFKLIGAELMEQIAHAKIAGRTVSGMPHLPWEANRLEAVVNAHGEVRTPREGTSPTSEPSQPSDGLQHVPAGSQPLHALDAEAGD